MQEAAASTLPWKVKANNKRAFISEEVLAIIKERHTAMSQGATQQTITELNKRIRDLRKAEKTKVDTRNDK
eukprot:4480422-Prorocentrum_lima.AAC.1